MIRAYRESDLAALVSLFTDSVHELAADHYAVEQRDAWAPRSPDMSKWAPRLARLNTIVAEAGSNIAGFISYEDNGHIDLLYTSPTYARRGIASSLYREAEARLVRDGVLELFAEASMAARPFFERFGFRMVEQEHVQIRGVELRRFAMRKALATRSSSDDVR